MSKANVDNVRARLQRDDSDYVSAVADLRDDAEWVIAKEHPNARTLRGREEIAGYLEEWATMFDDFRFEVAEYHDCGESVVAAGTAYGTGIGGGVPVEVPLTLLYRFAEGELIRVEEYLDTDEALAAASA